MKTRRTGKILLFIIIFVPLAIFVFGTIVMWLWNNALTPVLHVSTVTFWQALGILVLAKILFGNFGGGRGRRYPGWRERMARKWNSMTAEEKERFRSEWKERWWKGGYKPWDSENTEKNMEG